MHLPRQWRPVRSNDAYYAEWSPRAPREYSPTAADPDTTTRAGPGWHSAPHLRRCRVPRGGPSFAVAYDDGLRLAWERRNEEGPVIGKAFAGSRSLGARSCRAGGV